MMHESTAIRDALAALTSRNPYQRIAGLETLACHRYTPAIDDIFRLIRDADHRVREAAVWALGDIGSPAATEALRKLVERPNPTFAMRGIRWAAAHALGSIGDASALPGLFHLAVQEAQDDPDLASAARRAVLNFGENAVPLLINTLKNRMNETPEARQTAAYLLGQLRTMTAVRHLIDAAADDQPSVAWEAIRAMGEIGSPLVILFLIDVMNTDDLRLGAISAWALTMIGTPDARQAADMWRELHGRIDVPFTATPPERPDDLDVA